MDAFHQQALDILRSDKTRKAFNLDDEKKDVKITDVQPVGNYAVRLIFDDGHDTGLYTWPTLYELGCEQEAKWQAYLARLRAAGHVHPTQSE